MDQLYTPWRMNYLQGDGSKRTDCVFCAKVTADNEAEQIVARSDYVYVTLNLYPYNNGHLLVVPYQHVPSIEALPAEALTDLMLTTNRAIAALRKVYNPQAFNIGINLGAAAGAGIAEHVHMHIVPRWNGDTNYMTVTAHTRIIPDLLSDTWRKLKDAWNPDFSPGD
jgi:ATP adenylyltransferase